MINLVYPELQFSSAGLERLSEGERLEPISHLGLTVRTQNVLIWRKAETLGQLVDVLRSERGIGTVRNFGRKSHEELVHAVLALSEAVDSGGAVDWKKYAKLARKEFVGMRVSEAARFVGLLQAPDSTPKRNDWPRPFGKIPEELANQPLHSLPFSQRAFQGLKNMGATTIGEATRICPTDLLKLRNVGRKTMNEIYQTILSAVVPRTEDSIVRDDPVFAFPCVPMVPERSEGMPDNFYWEFFQEIRGVIRVQEGQEEEAILLRRLLRPLGEEATLEQTGKKFGVTRERIRQIEADLVRMFRAALLDGKYTYERLHPSKGLRYGKVQFRVQPEFQAMGAKLKAAMGVGMPLATKLSDWTARLGRVLGVSSEFVEEHTVFWARLLGYKALPIHAVRKVPGEILVMPESVTTKVALRIGAQVEALNRLLLENPGGLSQEELQKSKALFGNKTILKNVRDLASLSSVVQDPGGIILRPKTELVESLPGIWIVEVVAKKLAESRRPLKIQEILNDLKQKFPKIKKVPNRSTISMLMAGDRRFEANGRTGYWKIRST